MGAVVRLPPPKPRPRPELYNRSFLTLRLLSNAGIWGNAGKISGNVCNLRGDVSHLEGDVSTITGTIDSRLFGNVTRLRGDISDIWGLISRNIEGPATGLRGNIGNIVSGNLIHLPRGFVIPDNVGLIQITYDGDVIAVRYDPLVE